MRTLAQELRADFPRAMIFALIWFAFGFALIFAMVSVYAGYQVHIEGGDRPTLQDIYAIIDIAMPVGLLTAGIAVATGWRGIVAVLTLVVALALGYFVEDYTRAFMAWIMLMALWFAVTAWGWQGIREKMSRELGENAHAWCGRFSFLAGGMIGMVLFDIEPSWALVALLLAISTVLLVRAWLRERQAWLRERQTL